MLHSVFVALLGGPFDIKTTESNPLDTAPGCMPILEYRWYGSAGTCKPSGCNVISFKKNSRKLPGTLSERGLANRVKGVTRWTKTRAKKTKSETKTKKNRKRNKNHKTKKDSDFDTRLVGSNLYIN